MKNRLKGFLSAPRAALSKFSRDGCFASAAFLSYVSMLAMVPLTIVIFSLFTSFSTLMNAEKGMLEMLLKFFVPSSAKEAVDYIKRFSQNSGALGIGGTMGLISLSYALFESSERVLNDIWRSTRLRTFLNRILTFSNILFWLPFLLGTSFYITTKISRIPYMGSLPKLLLTFFPLLISATGFSFLYLIIPASKVETKAAFTGGVVAAAFWEIAKHLFDLYTRLALSFKAFTALYGPLIIFPVIMVWTYFSWLIVLYGAEVSYIVQHGKEEPENDTIPDFIAALEALIKIYKNFEDGGGPLPEDGIFRTSKLSRKSLRDTIKVLEKEGVIIETDAGFVPALPPEKVELSKIFERFTPPESDEGVREILTNIKSSIENKTLKEVITTELA